MSFEPPENDEGNMDFPIYPNIYIIFQGLKHEMSTGKRHQYMGLLSNDTFNQNIDLLAIATSILIGEENNVLNGVGYDKVLVFDQAEKFLQRIGVVEQHVGIYDFEDKEHKNLTDEGRQLLLTFYRKGMITQPDNNYSTTEYTAHFILEILSKFLYCLQNEVEIAKAP